MESSPEPVPDLPNNFGYYFNKVGQLTSVENEERFRFAKSKDEPDHDRTRYDALYKAVTKYVYHLLSTVCGLKRVVVPVDAQPDEPKGFCFISEDALFKETVLILITGAGKIRAGQWSRSLILEHGLDEGSQLSYIEFAQKLDLGVVVLNTNLNRASEVDPDKEGYIRGSETPEAHAFYVWDNFLEKSGVKHVVVIAHGYGGIVTSRLSNEREQFRKKLLAIAFIDSHHDSMCLSEESKRLFTERSVNWARGYEALNVALPDLHCSKRRSGGHSSYDWIPFTARKPIFDYILKEYRELKRRQNLTDFPKTLKALGYCFCEGQLLSTKNLEPFVYAAKRNDPSYNKRRYEALAKAITEYVYSLLEKEGCLNRIHIPIDAEFGEPRGFLFMTPAIAEEDTILMIIHGKGEVRAGEWNRDLTINHGLDEGSQLAYVEFGRRLNIGVVVMNPNLCRASEVGAATESCIRGSENPENHARYVWDTFLEKSNVRHIAVVANGSGAEVISYLSNEREEFRKRVFAIAFISSQLDSQKLSEETKQLFAERSVNWVTSSEDLDTILPDRDGLQCRSAGQLKLQWTPHAARKAIFRYILRRYKKLLGDSVLEARHLPRLKFAPFPDALKGLGYYFDELDDLRSIYDNSVFDYNAKEDGPDYNRERYEALGKVITERVYYFLEEEAGLRKVTIPVDAKDNEAKGFWFVGPETFQADAILLLINGAGDARAGQWSRSLIISHGLDEGSQLPYIEFGQKRKFGVVVLNTNLNKASEVDPDEEGFIHGSETPEAHALYVWDNFLEGYKEIPIFVVAHGYGGTVTAHLSNEREGFRNRLAAIALIDSDHDSKSLSEETKEVFERLSVNWVTSEDEVNNKLPDGECSKCRSAGHKLHEWTPYTARKSVFRYLAKKQKELDSIETVESLGYYFNEVGELRYITNNTRYRFVVEGRKWVANQDHYEKLGKAVTEFVYKLLVERASLDRVTIPVDAELTEPKGFFFMSPGALAKATLLIIINGSGAVRAGQWSRSLIINNGLDEGSQLSYIEFGQRLSLGIVVLNTNLNRAKASRYDKEKPIRGSETPEAHALYVWDNFIEKSKVKRVIVAAHSYGGVVTAYLSKEREEFRKRVFAIAFLDSVHDPDQLSKETRRLFVERSVNWMTSFEDADTQLPDHGDFDCRSAGHKSHEWTSYAARKSVFLYIVKVLRRVWGESVIFPYDRSYPITLKRKTLEVLGYCFNEDGRLTPVEDNVDYDCGINYKEQLDPRSKEKVLYKAITDHINMVMQEKGLEKYPIPIDGKLSEATDYFFMSPAAIDKTAVLLLIGPTDAGVWSHHLIVEKGLNEGSQLSYIEFGQKHDLGIVILNPGDDAKGGVRKAASRRGIETPMDHVLYVWDNIIEESGVKHVAVVAYSGGGLYASELSEKRAEFRKRVFALAFVQSDHDFYPTSDKVKRFLAKFSINWVARISPLDAEAPDIGGSKYRSAGNVSPELSVFTAQRPIFQYIFEEHMNLTTDTERAYPDTLEGFGYYFNSNGELKTIYGNNRWNLATTKNKRMYPRQRYKALGAVIDQHIYTLLEEEAGLKRVTIPIDAADDEPTGFFFMSPGALDKETILLIINGAGRVTAGQWCRWLILFRGLKFGSQLPYIEFGQKQGYGIVVLNPNVNKAKVQGSDETRCIRGSYLPEEHALYVWDYFLEKSSVKHVAVVAREYGAFIVKFLAFRRAEFRRRVFATAFIECTWTPEPLYLKHAVNWFCSQTPLDTFVLVKQDLVCRSAGTEVSDLCCYAAQEAIFSYIAEQHKLRLAGGQSTTETFNAGALLYNDYAQALEQAGMEKVTLPLHGEDEPKGFFFKTPRAFDKKFILLIVDGAGEERAEQPSEDIASRNVTSGLRAETMLPYINFGKVRLYGVVVLNTNLNRANQEPCDSTSPESLALYVWDHFLEGSAVKHIAVVAHGYGGVVVSVLSNKREEFRKRVYAIALINSLHTLDGLTEPSKLLFREHSVNWVTSSEEVNSTLPDREGSKCRSAGHKLHDWVAYTAHRFICDYIDGAQMHRQFKELLTAMKAFPGMTKNMFSV